MLASVVERAALFISNRFCDTPSSRLNFSSCVKPSVSTTLKSTTFTAAFSSIVAVDSSMDTILSELDGSTNSGSSLASPTATFTVSMSLSSPSDTVITTSWLVTPASASSPFFTKSSVPMMLKYSLSVVYVSASLSSSVASSMKSSASSMLDTFTAEPTIAFSDTHALAVSEANSGASFTSFISTDTNTVPRMALSLLRSACKTTEGIAVSMSAFCASSRLIAPVSSSTENIASSPGCPPFVPPVWKYLTMSGASTALISACSAARLLLSLESRPASAPCTSPVMFSSMSALSEGVDCAGFGFTFTVRLMPMVTSVPSAGLNPSPMATSMLYSPERSSSTVLGTCVSISVPSSFISSGTPGTS